MTESRTSYEEKDQPILRYGYMSILLFLTLSGFGQMPIFKRYYIADIPGLGWLAKFFVTHTIHYLGAILLLALFAYILVNYLLLDRSRHVITRSGYFRGILLGAIVITGIFLVLRNLRSFWLPPGFIIFLDIMHLGLVMTFLISALYCLFSKKQWTKPREIG
jgi:uncharacterized membrane protein (UPF0182 family)